MKLKLEIEVEYEPQAMHGKEPDGVEWFRNFVLLNTSEGEGLILHSNMIGDSIGDCRVTRIISGL